MLFLPAVFAVLGLFVGRRAARPLGLCPHASKVWGALGLPLLLLPFMMPHAPLVFFVSVGAALGAGLTAHRSMRWSLLAVIVGVLLATGLAVVTRLA